VGDIRKIEWPTVLLAVCIYTGWLGLTLLWNRLSPWLVLPLGAWLGAWHMSLQHEVMHRHPTRSQRLNDAIGFAPFMLWMPYFRYKDTHLQHHQEEWLTDPLRDPESAYLAPDRWRRMSRPVRWLHLARVTLLGRLIAGPVMAIASSWIGELGLIADGDRRIARIWVGHLAGVALLLGWLVLVCHINLFSYVLLVVWPGTALGLVRSLVEHKAAVRPQDRTSVVESGGPLALLFLNNNLHIVHHLYPGLPWYTLPAVWRKQKAELTLHHLGPVYRSYFNVASLFLLKPHNRGAIAFGTPEARLPGGARSQPH
jgi:fatty acid desaturase